MVSQLETMKQFLQLFILLITVSTSLTTLRGQCENSIIDNGSFESGIDTAWWNWHDNSPDSYSFATSSDAYSGDSSAVINVLMDTDLIPGGQGGEYNSRPQMNAITGGQFYEIQFYAKSTVDSTRIPLYVKDENDGWVLLHSDQTPMVGTEWTQVTSRWQADTDRDDVHVEIKVYNDGFHDPYSVFIDEVSICQVEVLTNTCEGNLVANPGFEDGANMDWWNYHGGEESDYAFSTGEEGAVGNASGKISVLKPGAELTGAGEFNSRPQVSPVVADQNYKVSLFGKSTIENTTIQVYVKDEFDGWTTLGNADLVVGTDWTEASFVFTNDIDRDDVHIEIKVVNPDFTEAYDVWVDEVALCTTDEEPGGGPDEPTTPTFYGVKDDAISCSVNLSDEFTTEDMMNDGLGWDIWDGSEDEDRAVFELDAILPYSGDASMRIDVNADNDVAEFHHRFGNDLVLEDGKEYTVTMWMRAELPAGDTIRAFTRAVRDTDWSSQFAADFVSTENEWFNYSSTFIADGDWDNAFLEIKFYRVTGFTDAYKVWVDDIQFCSSGDAVVSSTDLTSLGLQFGLAPNPATSGYPTYLNIESERSLKGAQLMLFDALGRNVWAGQTDIFPGEQRVELNTNNLAPGFYLLNIRQEGYTHNLKLQVAGVRP